MVRILGYMSSIGGFIFLIGAGLAPEGYFEGEYARQLLAGVGIAGVLVGKVAINRN